MKQHICPWWLAYTFDNPLRRLFHKPGIIFAPYISEGMIVADFGCGMGYFSIGLAKIVGDEGQVIAVDVQQKMLDTLYLSGLLHDIGKIGVDDSVLRKPGNLTDAEYEHIKKHVRIGHRILTDLKKLDEVLPVVLYRGWPVYKLLLWWGGSEVGATVPDGLRDLPVCVPISTQCLHAAGLAWGARWSVPQYEGAVPESRRLEKLWGPPPGALDTDGRGGVLGSL